MNYFAYILAIWAFGQTGANSGQITGVVKDPDQACRLGVPGHSHQSTNESQDHGRERWPRRVVFE